MHGRDPGYHAGYSRRGLLDLYANCIRTLCTHAHSQDALRLITGGGRVDVIEDGQVPARWGRSADDAVERVPLREDVEVKGQLRFLLAHSWRSFVLLVFYQ